MHEAAFPPVGAVHVQEVLRAAGSALQDRAVALFETGADGELVPIAASPGTRFADAAADECRRALDEWRVTRPEGERWLACLLGVGRWCVAKVAPDVPVPAGKRERRGSERVTLELAARYLGLLERVETEIAAARASEAELRKGALYDPLTGLPNRALFLERVSQALQHAVRESDYRFAVMFLDVDHFKAINDSLGHAAGDEVLAALAKRLEAVTRPGDQSARLVGDEFAMFLEDVGTFREATQIAERVETQFDAPFTVGGQEIYVTASIGIALSDGESRAEDLLRDADLATYRAKSLGRARHQVFDPSMRDRARRRLSLAQDLRRAVDREEFRVFYQPILDLRTDRLDGFEALVRWLHPSRGLLQPQEFIGAAEETGLIVPLGSWVLSEACRQARAWQREHPRADPIHISINLSARQVQDGSLMDHVATALLQSGLEPKSLRLEITENVLLEGGGDIAALLDHLRTLEVQLQLDDFGTGYSSLGYLRRFPLDALKVDRSFVRRLGVRRHDLELVRTIVALAQNLNLGVIAEGVESAAQRDRLLELGCPLGQGFLFAEPMPAAEIASKIWT